MRCGLPKFSEPSPMAMLYTTLKCLQLLPNGLGGSMMSLDFLHGMVRKDMVPKMGFPAWFPTALGFYKLTQAALNWIAGGAYMPVAQAMMAFQVEQHYSATCRPGRRHVRPLCLPSNSRDVNMFAHAYAIPLARGHTSLGRTYACAHVTVGWCRFHPRHRRG